MCTTTTASLLLLPLALFCILPVAFGFGFHLPMTESSSTIVTPLASARNSNNTALILLNTPLPGSPLFYHLWDTATVRICADGGANRLYRLHCNNNNKDSDDSSSATRTRSSTLLPDTIVGDLDSLHDDTRAYYSSSSEQHGVEILHDPDQDSNDLDKAIRVAQRPRSDNNIITTIIIYGSMGGRLDQSIACLHALLHYSCSNSCTTPCQYEYFWYSDTSMACVIPPSLVPHRLVVRLPAPPSPSANNNNNTAITAADVTEGPTCGLLPLGTPVDSVTTTGLQWNLHQQSTQMGHSGLVSTSNRIVTQQQQHGADDRDPDDAVVTIRTSHPLIFTAEVHCGMKTEWTEEQ